MLYRRLSRVSSRAYPAFFSSPTTLDFSDQFAFRLTGSTTRYYQLLQLITNMLLSNPYVIVISLDFIKACQGCITAGIIQGSRIGPTVTAGDLQPITEDNKLMKYADDTYCNSCQQLAHTFSGDRQR